MFSSIQYPSIVCWKTLYCLDSQYFNRFTISFIIYKTSRVPSSKLIPTPEGSKSFRCAQYTCGQYTLALSIVWADGNCRSELQYCWSHRRSRYIVCLVDGATGRFRIKGAAPENFLSAPPTLGGCTSLLERFTLRRQQVLQSHFFLYGKMKQ